MNKKRSYISEEKRLATICVSSDRSRTRCAGKAASECFSCSSLRDAGAPATSLLPGGPSATKCGRQSTVWWRPGHGWHHECLCYFLGANWQCIQHVPQPNRTLLQGCRQQW